LNETLDVLSR